MISPGRRLAAWGVHLLTASGFIWGLYGLAAVARGDWQVALAMMALAMAIDAFDGMLARGVGVSAATPGFDGALLDNLVDYLNYVVVPAFLLWRAPLLPQGAGPAVAVGVLLASAYQFCQRDAKTEDHFFKGFPSFWNVAVFYLLLMHLGQAWNLAILLGLCVAVFVPLKWAYPSRMLRLRRTTLMLTGIWGLSILALLLRYPDPPAWLLRGSLAYPLYYVAVSLYLSARSPLKPAAAAGTSSR